MHPTPPEYWSHMESFLVHLVTEPSQKGCSEASLHSWCAEIMLRTCQLFLLPLALRITRALFQLEWQTPSAPPQGDLFLRVAGYGIRIQSVRLKRKSAPPMCVIYIIQSKTRSTENCFTALIKVAAFSHTRRLYTFLLVYSNIVVLKMSGHKHTLGCF